jgi:hypothetical protein
VLEADWSGPQRVPVDHIDLAHKDSWAAATDGRVPGFVRKLRGKHAKGKQLKPAVYVRTPNSTHDVVVDGHHRTLAYLEAGQSPYAYVGRVKTETGDWDEMHNAQGTVKTGAAA